MKEKIMRGKWMFIAPLAILGIAVAAGIGGGLVMLLWNWLVPSIFGWSQVSFWQALGLLALCRILFGGMGRHVVHRARWNAEEKARFRQRMRERLGLDPSAAENPGH
jgi:hypothetical protein